MSTPAVDETWVSDASVEDVMVAVCERFDLRMVDLRGPDRHKTIAGARHIAMYLCKHRLRTSPSFPEIGRAFGNRDHTTVMSAVRKIEAQRASDPQVRAHVVALEKVLGLIALQPVTRLRIAIPEPQ